MPRAEICGDTLDWRCSPRAIHVTDKPAIPWPQLVTVIIATVLDLAEIRRLFPDLDGTTYLNTANMCVVEV